MRSNMKARIASRKVTRAFVAVGAIMVGACGDPSALDESDLGENNIELGSVQQALSGSVGAGAILRVKTTALNLREGPGTSHSILAVLSENEQVEVVERSGDTGWVRVKSSSGTVGWAFAEYLELVSLGVVEEGTILSVTATALNLREGPGTSYSVLGVLSQDDQVQAVERSGEYGWIHVESLSSGMQGWASARYLEAVTCDPSRAAGVVGSYQKAMHDSIAWAEGTRGYSKDGYDVKFGFHLMPSCYSHPDDCIKFGSTCSTAAGRYQFLTRTWNGAMHALQLSSFEPDNQERAGQYLVRNVRKVTVPQDRAMTAAEFSNAMSKLSYEWASLPPGRYGQPVKTQSQMWNFYNGVLP
jgi:muramidase (phage lysozyme)